MFSNPQVLIKQPIKKTKYIIAIDAGATSTEAVLYSGSPNVKINKFDAVNFNVLGFTKTVTSLTQIIKSVSKNVGLKNIGCVSTGISGARNIKDRQRIGKALSKSLKIKYVRIFPDTEIAFASMFNPKQTNCGILIAGTGSVLYYKDKRNKLHRIGGWGRLIDDLGSGYWIGREGLNTVTRSSDNRTKNTILVNAVKKEFGLNDKNILQKIYHEGFPIGSIARIVFRSAEKGDKISKQIIIRAAEHLFEHFKTLPNKNAAIGLIGSLFTKETLLEKHLRRITKKVYPKIKFVKAINSPVWGAIKLELYN